MIILDPEQLSEWIARANRAPGSDISIILHEKDAGDVYSSFHARQGSATTPGFFRVVAEGTDSALAVSSGCAVLVVAERARAPGRARLPALFQTAGATYRLSASLRCEGEAPRPAEVIVAPLKEQLFSRLGGIFETEALADREVVLVGVGSGSSPVALELAKSGVRRFVLIDHDRLEVGNVARHVCGISDLGRFKTLAVRDAILDKNPDASVRTYQRGVAADFMGELEEVVRGAALVICGTDNRESRMLVNRCCVVEGKTCLYGGAFRRAYGGQVLRVRPGESLCYQCFIDALPHFATDEEISQVSQAVRVQYSPDDPLIPIEPGLSTDIAPISLQISKLAIMELLRGEETTLAPLYDDLVADWYLWLNRREPKTDYARLEPLGFGTDGMRILRWYGVEVERNPHCPVCGDFTERFTEQVRQEDLDFFRTARDA